MSSPSPRKSLKACIKHLTPSWYAVIMGTGVVSSLVNRFHFGARSEELKVLTLLLFFLNLLCFVLICAATLARYVMFPALWPAMLRHPTQSLFVGALPMGACTLINIALVAHTNYSFASGLGFLYTLWAFWWLNAVLSVAIAVGMLNIMITRQQHSLVQHLWVLPVVPCIVASSTGGLIAAALPAHGPFVGLTTAVSSILLIVGLSLALMMITSLLLRLVIHGSPDTSLILSSFIPLGPMGQGGFSSLILAQNLTHGGLDLGPFFSPSAVASVAFCAAWLLWSMGFVWLPIALSQIYSSVRHKPVPFSVAAYWGMIFPTGVFALLTVELGSVLQSPTIQYLGAIFSIGVCLLWCFVVVKTVPAVWQTTAFNSPCATKLEEETFQPASST
ncbi:voltage-dependent anion channel [Mycena amicta]|nr:voltage-dependent anion channel [Mycena amicta]